MSEKLSLYAPASYRNASQAEINAVCNGCGTKGFAGWITPDTLYGLRITDACNIHDWMYKFGETLKDKFEADLIFLENMVKIIDNESIGILKLPRSVRAVEYYRAVRDFGTSAFWAGKS